MVGLPVCVTEGIVERVDGVWTDLRKFRQRTSFQDSKAGPGIQSGDVGCFIETFGFAFVCSQSAKLALWIPGSAAQPRKDGWTSVFEVFLKIEPTALFTPNFFIA
jgi:hypothetical protein